MSCKSSTLETAFSLVDPTCAAIGRDWKAPINLSGSPAAINAVLDHLGVSLMDVSDAVEHFTATRLEVTATGGMMHLRAAGYRAGPAGDH